MERFLVLWLCISAFSYRQGESFLQRGVSLSSTGKRSSSTTSSSTRQRIMSSAAGITTSSVKDSTSTSTGSQGRPGILIVGFGGGNGVTVAAGVLSNQKNITWEGPTGRNSPNYLGCITQLPSKGGSGGYRERYPLADANNAAIGGWDIRPTPLGEALYNARILDFDLVRQVREEMDTLRLLPGVWDPDFIGESQHESARHVTGDGDSQQSRLDHLRKDIRKFREGEGVTGHVTVIWSASVERPSEREFRQPSEVCRYGQHAWFCMTSQRYESAISHSSISTQMIILLYGTSYKTFRMIVVSYHIVRYLQDHQHRLALEDHSSISVYNMRKYNTAVTVRIFTRKLLQQCVGHASSAVYRFRLSPVFRLHSQAGKCCAWFTKPIAVQYMKGRTENVGYSKRWFHLQSLSVLLCTWYTAIRDSRCSNPSQTVSACVCLLNRGSRLSLCIQK